jgi:prephenate dehydrogenase
MRPVILDPVQHDELVAQASHLPYLLSLALVRAIADDARSIAGPALNDMTRVARSPAAMWAAICRDNRDAILRALARFEAELGRLRRGLEAGVIHEVLTR